MSAQDAKSHLTQTTRKNSSDTHTKPTVSDTKTGTDGSKGRVEARRAPSTNIGTESHRTKVTSIGFDEEEDVDPMYWCSVAPPFDERPKFAAPWFEDDTEPEICTMVGGPPDMIIEGELGPATELPWERGDQERYPQSKKS